MSLSEVKTAIRNLKTAAELRKWMRSVKLSNSGRAYLLYRIQLMSPHKESKEDILVEEAIDILSGKLI
jgi:hypothetical protein